jgi:hypothetical protein
VKPQLATKEDLQQELANFRSDVMTKMDEVHKEVLTVRQEQAMHSGSHERMDEKLKDHEGRLKDLESPVTTAHDLKR